MDQAKGDMKQKDIKEMSIEECFAELQTVVDVLENDQIALEESVKCFERGMALSRKCSDALSAVERRIQQVVAADNGTLHLENVEETDEFRGDEDSK